MGEIFAVMTQDVSLAISGNQWEEDQEQWNIPSTIQSMVFRQRRPPFGELNIEMVQKGEFAK